ncbi:dna-directed rna polymerase [Trichoderma cornu-damae]|uniref:DNA-directed RNA polymerase n=1 Tax=Trichoderma cornu-damae TaxID=654480 RepID=A0A9P8QG09_9HYPO|nr:dna-directed rna polymerase [Trichoderma cornu-damae]
MLSRHAGHSASVHHVAAFRSIRASSRLPSLQACISTLGPRGDVAKHLRPWRRGLDLGFGSHERSLATAVEDFKVDGMPYNHLPNSSIPPLQAPASPFELHAFKPSPLTIPEPGPPKPLSKMNTYGIPGEPEDMFMVFDACIKVGKLERAALVLKRLSTMGTVSGEEQIILNNKYLRASLNQMRKNPQQSQAEQLHKWYELQIRNKGLPHTAETVACMLKASLLSERGARLDRLVKRYMGMAPHEAGLRVLSMDEILSDQDLAVITRICPTYNFVADAEGLQDLAFLPENYEEAESPPALAAELGEPTEVRAAPELIPTPQRGEGLDTLKKGLGLLLGLQDVDISKLPYSDRRDIQLQLERDSISSAIERWRLDNKSLSKRGVTTTLAPSAKEGSMSQNLASWMSAMEARIQQELRLIELSEAKKSKSDWDLTRCIYGPFIQLGDPARLAAVTILSALNLGTILGVEKGIPISRLITHIAKAVQDDTDMYQKELAERKARRQRKLRFVGKPDEPGQEASSAQTATSQDATPALVDATEEQRTMEENSRNSWSLQIKAQVGSILLQMLIESAKINVVAESSTSKELISQYQPAFNHQSLLRKGKKIGALFFNPHLIEQLKREPMGDFIAKHLPMVVEPKPWASFSEGGFLDTKTSLVRVKPGDVEQKLYTSAAINRGDMEQVFRGLDVLGKTAWIINKETLNVMMEAWNSGEEVANIPPLNPHFEVPPEPDSSADPLVRRNWIRTVKAIENERSGLHSQRCFMNLQLEIARAFRNQTIYFPHNVDYRGRAYPMPTYLNHMGADHARSILKFAEGKELGARGLRWLKIHLANVYGLDKASFDEREAFADENVANIIDSATNPLGGSRWWLKGEDPWQCLSACFELRAALKLADPTKFISHLPVHQDGTCNGLQHYAALGGDTWGAKQVNLEPGERPADVYSAVASLVKDAIAKDLEDKDPFAEALNGKITRKVVKQTVMTNVYGVTFAGAKKQICKQLDALYPNLGKECGIPNMLLSTYVAKQVFQALATMFRGAHDIQYWLGDIGGRVCRALTPAQLKQIADSYGEGEEGASHASKPRGMSVSGKKLEFDDLVQQFRSSVVWTTPLRMPVVQPYRKTTAREIKTCLQAVIYPLSDQTDPVNRRKQLQGFPPNFIHSLDASHMLLSALECEARGLDFAAVHDSFWTHAGDIDVMNEVLREAFIRIHEEDVVGRLGAEFEARHEGSIYLAKIDPDTPVAQKIKELRKMSKLSPKEELLLEHKRNQLKLSGNPWDLEAAKQIVTPASVYEDMMAAEVDMDIQEDARDIGLGAIPEDEARGIDEEIEGQSENPSKAAELTKRLMKELNLSFFESKVAGPKAPARKARKLPLPVWLPLTIPTVPKKGDFDVKRLRESKYFFS